MPDGLVTNRPIQNESTGIDLQVPVYQEVRGPMMSGHVEYKIIVVTRLAAFKSPRHKPADTVQLVVSKQFSDFDELYSRLTAQYPRIRLPAMPRKALLVGEADIRERRAAFDGIVRVIAKDPTLATAAEVLDFLGAKTTDIKTRNVLLGEEPEEEEMNFFQGEEASVPKETDVVFPPTRPWEDPNEEEEEEPFLGPLGNPRSMKKPKPHPPPRPTQVSLLGDGQSTDGLLYSFAAKEDDLKLFEDPWLGDTWLPPTAPTQAGASSCPGQDEDTDELFRVDKDFDKVLQLTKRTQGRPSNRQPEPSGSRGVEPPGGGATAGPPLVAAEQLKDQADILKYIQQNELEAGRQDDLF